MKKYGDSDVWNPLMRFKIHFDPGYDTYGLFRAMHSHNPTLVSSYK